MVTTRSGGIKRCRYMKLVFQNATLNLFLNEYRMMAALMNLSPILTAGTNP